MIEPFDKLIVARTDVSQQTAKLRKKMTHSLSLFTAEFFGKQFKP